MPSYGEYCGDATKTLFCLVPIIIILYRQLIMYVLSITPQMNFHNNYVREQEYKKYCMTGSAIWEIFSSRVAVLAQPQGGSIQNTRTE